MEGIIGFVVIAVILIFQIAFSYWYIIAALMVGYFIANVVDAYDIPRRESAIKSLMAQAYNQGRVDEARQWRDSPRQ